MARAQRKEWTGMLKIDSYEQTGCTVLRLEGDIDEEGMNTLRLSLMECIQNQQQ